MWRAIKTLKLVGVMAALVVPVCAAKADETDCSDPERERALAEAALQIPWSQVGEFSRWLAMSSEETLGMSFSSVGVGTEDQPLTKQILILQSPKVSVSIEITARIHSKSADVEVMRTCITDDFEAWWPYWMRFKSAMKSKGYVLSSR